MIFCLGWRFEAATTGREPSKSTEMGFSSRTWRPASSALTAKGVCIDVSAAITTASRPGCFRQSSTDVYRLDATHQIRCFLSWRRRGTWKLTRYPWEGSQPPRPGTPGSDRRWQRAQSGEKQTRAVQASNPVSRFETALRSHRAYIHCVPPTHTPDANDGHLELPGRILRGERWHR